ncbi:MAG: ABC transporter permease, partial [Actinomycetota bacterium]|nr:ABC transporter permease [Actinomycetota bacterium]
MLAAEPWVRWDWVGRHLGLIAGDLGQHIEMTGIAVLGGLLIAAPTALVGWRFRPARGAILGLTGALYT